MTNRTLAVRVSPTCIRGRRKRPALGAGRVSRDDVRGAYRPLIASLPSRVEMAR